MDLFGDLPAPSNEAPSKLGPSAKVDTDKVKLQQETVKRRLEDVHPCQIKKKKLEEFALRGYVSALRGERDEMQDTHVILEDFTPFVNQLDSSIQQLSYFAVFDGHGGARTSKYAAAQLHQILAEHFPKGDITMVEKDIKKCFVETFRKADEEFLKAARKSKPSWKDGSTAVAILQMNDTVYVANLGDSKAVLSRYNDEEKQYCAVALTKDHECTDYQERMRIQKAGGFVKDGRVMGQLEISRSLGDGPLKNHGLSCLPDVRKCQLTAKDRFIVLACDGFWKAFGVDEAIKHLNRVLEELSEKPDLPEVSDSNSRKTQFLEHACSKMAADAVRRLSGDNVTVILVAINKVSDVEQQIC